MARASSIYICKRIRRNHWLCREQLYRMVILTSFKSANRDRFWHNSIFDLWERNIRKSVSKLENLLCFKCEHFWIFTIFLYFLLSQIFYIWYSIEILLLTFINNLGDQKIICMENCISKGQIDEKDMSFGLHRVFGCFKRSLASLVPTCTVLHSSRYICR